MLVITRNRNERVMLFDEYGRLQATISIEDVRGNKVKLGIAADPTTRIYREELLPRLDLDPETRS